MEAPRPRSIAAGTADDQDGAVSVSPLESCTATATRKAAPLPSPPIGLTRVRGTRQNTSTSVCVAPPRGGLRYYRTALTPRVAPARDCGHPLPLPAAIRARAINVRPFTT